MLASRNILSPANGQPLAVPTQDMVLGCYYLTKEKKNAKGEGRAFASAEDVLLALEAGEVETLSPIRLLYSGQLIDLTTAFNDQDVVHSEIQDIEHEVIDTTVGRVIFNDHLPGDIPFVNGLLKKKGLGNLVNFCYLRHGIEKTVHMLDSLKELGFSYATRSGVSIGIEDLVIPSQKNDLVEKALSEVKEVDDQYREGAITKGERYNKVIAIWSNVTDSVAQEMFEEMERQEREQSMFNPIYMMADSGARGSKQQIRQLAGMRGLMAKPSGEIIETPITSNFREGLTVLQYFISTHGARKGLADTALKTADSGYLTRRLVDVAQDVIVSEDDCGTLKGIYVGAIVEAGEVIEALRDRIVGRVSTEKIKDSFTGETIVEHNQEITEDIANAIQNTGVEKVKIRSVLTCESRRGVCAMCYGRNLATGMLVDLGEATGVIAAQSIGEPGTQLTMRTFHIGGTASRVAEQSTLEAKNDGIVKFINLATVKDKDKDLVVMNRTGQIAIVDQKGRERERYPVVYGAKLKVKDGQVIKSNQAFVEWDPYTFSILTEEGGSVHYKDIVQGLTVNEEVDEVTGLSMPVIIETQDEKRQPAIMIKDVDGKEARTYLLPSGAHLMVGDGEDVFPGQILAKIPRETTKTKDITGGLPRVVELFEARKPKDPAVITEVDGIVRYGGISKGLRKITVEAESSEVREYSVPRGVHINVQEGERVRAGEPLMDGPINPHDILNVLGENELQNYLVNEIQEVYRLQGVNINDKHIEVIVRQMMRWVKIEDVGDTQFLIDETVDKFRFAEENEKVVLRGGRPATGRPLLLGITKASLSTDSFISAASFQETTRVLTEASISGRVDYLRGLKENVIMGRLIPAGTGLEHHRRVMIPEAQLAERPSELVELASEELDSAVEYIAEDPNAPASAADTPTVEAEE
jgi:DNA-directed RNA polymerase subunit beta'